MSPEIGLTCHHCGKTLEVIFFCLHCAETFCSQDCFEKHVQAHVLAHGGKLTEAGDPIFYAESVYGGSVYRSVGYDDQDNPACYLEAWTVALGICQSNSW